MCPHITAKWEELKASVASQDDKKTEVTLRYFAQVPVTSKKGVVSMKWRALNKQATMISIIEFIEKLLVPFIHHRNLLKHLRSTVHALRQEFNAIWMDVDLSENLSVPVDKEIQPLHWGKPQVTVHSGIVKLNGDKAYHPYISESLVHDQELVATAIQKMIKSTDSYEVVDYIIIESDNAIEYKFMRTFSSDAATL